MDDQQYWGDSSGNIHRMSGEQEVIATATAECTTEEWLALCDVTVLRQPEESPVQTYYAYFSEGERYVLIGFQSFIEIVEARKRGVEYAKANGFLGFTLMTAREVVLLK